MENVANIQRWFQAKHICICVRLIFSKQVIFVYIIGGNFWLFVFIYLTTSGRDAYFHICILYISMFLWHVLFLWICLSVYLCKEVKLCLRVTGYLARNICVFVFVFHICICQCASSVCEIVTLTHEDQRPLYPLYTGYPPHRKVAPLSNSLHFGRILQRYCLSTYNTMSYLFKENLLDLLES